MKIIRRIAFFLALILVMTGMSGKAYAENRTDPLSGENAALSESEGSPKEELPGDDLPPEELQEEPAEETPAESAEETPAAPQEEPSGEETSAEESAEETQADSAEETQQEHPEETPAVPAEESSGEETLAEESAEGTQAEAAEETGTAPQEEPSGEAAPAEESAEETQAEASGETQQEYTEETSAVPSEESSGEGASAGKSAEETKQKSAEETKQESTEKRDTPEANAAAEAPGQFTAVETPAEPTLTQLRITWSSTDTVQFIVKDAVKWNAAALCWETDEEQNGEVSLKEDHIRKAITIQNGSGEPLTATVSFTLAEDLPEALQDAYEGFSFSGRNESIPAGETVDGTVTVSFKLDEVRLTDETITGGTLGSFTIQLSSETDSGEENPSSEATPSTAKSSS